MSDRRMSPEFAGWRPGEAAGDAAVVARAGRGTVFGDDGVIQNPTMFFRLGDVDLAAFGAARSPRRA